MGQGSGSSTSSRCIVFLAFCFLRLVLLIDILHLLQNRLKLVSVHHIHQLLGRHCLGVRLVVFLLLRWRLIHLERMCCVQHLCIGSRDERRKSLLCLIKGDVTFRDLLVLVDSVLEGLKVHADLAVGASVAIEVLSGHVEGLLDDRTILGLWVIRVQHGFAVFLLLTPLTRRFIPSYC